MGVLFARAFAQQNLLDAWQRVRDAALADGRPDAEVERFEADAARRVAHLPDALAEGEWRLAPAVRVVERALLAVLDPEIGRVLLPWSSAYRRGLGTKDAIAALTEARDTGWAASTGCVKSSLRPAG